MDDTYEIGRATAGDIDVILDLQERKLPHNGGTLSARFPRPWFEAAVAAMPVIVARRTDRLTGYLVSSAISAYTGVPVVQAMLAAYAGSADAYVYGPICVDERDRGRGIAGRMFAALLSELPGREGILFIRRDNDASLRAHARMGIHRVADFEHDGTLFDVLAYSG